MLLQGGRERVLRPTPEAPTEPALEEPNRPRRVRRGQARTHGPAARASAGHRGDPRPRTGQGVPERVALHRSRRSASNSTTNRPASLRRRLIRRKFVRRGDADATPIIAPLPPCLQERGLPTAGLLAQVLDRQVRRPPAALPPGGDLPSTPRRASAPADPGALGGPGRRLAASPSTMRSARACSRAATSRWTRHPSLTWNPGMACTRQGYLWTYARPGGDVLFDWQTGRGAACLARTSSRRL